VLIGETPARLGCSFLAFSPPVRAVDLEEDGALALGVVFARRRVLQVLVLHARGVDACIRKKAQKRQNYDLAESCVGEACILQRMWWCFCAACTNTSTIRRNTPLLLVAK